MEHVRQPAGSSRLRNVARAVWRLPLQYPLRITIPILLLVSGAVLTVVSLFVSYGLVDQRVEQDVSTDLHRDLAQMRPAVVRDLVTNDADALQQQVGALTADPSVRVGLVEADGVIVASIRPGQVGRRVTDAAATDRNLAAVLRTNVVSRSEQTGERTLTLLGSDNSVAGALAFNLQVTPDVQGARAGLVIVERSLVGAKSEARTDARHQALFLAAFVIGATIVIGSFVYFAVARRVRKLGTNLDDFAAGDTAARSALGGNDEVAQLGRAFDDMADRIGLTQARLAESEESVRRLLDSTAEGIIGLDERDRCTFVNRAALEMLRYDAPTDLIGADAHAVLHHTRADGTPFPREDCAISASILETRGEAHRDDEVFWRADGTSFPVEYWAHPVERDGRVEAAVLAFIDISARRRDELERAAMEEQLRQSQRLETVGQLAGGIAHDFNNLLTVIVLLSDSLARQVRDDGHLATEVSQIRAAADRGAELTRQLLTFSRRDIAQPQVVVVDEVIGGVRDLLAGTLGDSISLRVVCTAGARTVNTDPGQFAQVLVNLAMNARDAMPDGGTVTITSFAVCLDGTEARPWHDLAPGEYVGITVTDTGTGMTPEVKARAFEPFFTTKPLGTGTGLGLATVYGIAGQFGGAVRLTSEPGAGTSVEILLPEAGDARIGDDGEAADGGQRGPATVLVVEDQAEVRRLLVRILESGGYRVLTAGDGVEALETARGLAGPPDVVLTDVVMPGMSGSALVTELREVWRDQSELRVLYMSGYTDGALADQGMLADGAQLIQKPFARDDLLARLAVLAGRR